MSRPLLKPTFETGPDDIKKAGLQVRLLPNIDDDIGAWLEPRTVAALREVSVDTLRDLVVRVKRRNRWWVPIPWLGPAGARRVEVFLSAHRGLLN